MNLPNLCLQIVVNKLEGLKPSFTADTLSHDGNKSDAPKAKEGKGKPAAISKSGSTHETVILHHNTQWHWSCNTCHVKLSKN